MNLEREKTACHEAGHAVAALILGRSFGAVLGSPGHAVAGLAGTGDLDTTDYQLPTPDQALERARGRDLRELLDEATIDSAGFAAVALWQECAMLPLGSIGDDRAIQAAAVAAFPGSDISVRNAFKQLAYRLAVWILGTRWPAVRAVADALLASGRLSAAQVAEVFADALRSPVEHRPAKDHGF